MNTGRRIPTQAIILVGGEGTRLRPVTSRVPKPVAPVVERPFVAYILDDLARHGVERAIFSTGFLAAAIEAEIGDGAGYGLHVDYAVESEPLGTAGAVANCADKLDDGSFYVFNGDVLSDVDLTALATLHAGKGGMGTIFLTPVEDPRRYGLVELREDGSVASYLEKPGEWQGTALINAGVYVLEHEVLEMIPRGRLFSIERGVFPRLAQAGSLYGYVDRGYWRDIGTPESYLQAHFDILERTVDTAVGDMLGEQYLYIAASADIDARARVVPPCYIGENARVEAGARVGPLAVLGAGAVVAEGATILESVIQAGVVIGAQAQVERSIVVRRSSVGAGTQLHSAVIGEGCRVGAGNRLVGGICLYPDTMLPDNSIQFHEQLRGRED
ncbi:MAG: NDP-sugar synthase [Actinobacteria bacterium]|nr:NDP-sugar synthase [Actinomycetota bacterium]